MVIRPEYLTPFVPQTTNRVESGFPVQDYNLRLTVAAVQYEATVTLVQGREYWVSADGATGTNETDLLTLLCTAIENSTGIACTPSRLSDGRVRISTASTQSQIDWDSPYSTLPPEIFGFRRTRYLDVSYTYTSDTVPSGSWVPGRVWTSDVGDYPDPVAVSQATSGGESKGYLLSEGAPKRDQTYTNLPGAAVTQFYTHVSTWASGSRIRIYPDVVDRTTYGTYRWVPGPMPLLNNARAVRYDLTLNFIKAVRGFTADYAFGFVAGPPTQYLDAPYPASNLLFYTARWSVACWIRPSNTVSFMNVLNRTTTGGNQFALIVNNDMVLVKVSENASDTTTQWQSAGVLTAGVWTHVLVTYDRAVSGTGKLVVYVDGVDVTSGGTFTGAWGHTAGVLVALPVRFGANQSATFPFIGELDEVAYWREYVVGATDAADMAVSVTDLSTLAVPPDDWWRAELDFTDSGNSAFWSPIHLTSGDSPGFSPGAFV